MICKVDNLKWIRSTIKREVKEKLTEGISPKKKVGKRKTKKRVAQWKVYMYSAQQDPNGVGFEKAAIGKLEWTEIYVS